MFPLDRVAQRFQGYRQWPGLDDMQQMLDALTGPIITAGGAPLRLVPQDDKASQFEHHYAPRIYLTGEVQTRLENWHDFFQAASWSLFPKTKVVINDIHFHAAQRRFQLTDDRSRRSPQENALSLFDECGAVLVAEHDRYLDMVRHHAWHELFWQNRSAWGRSLNCYLFGHAMYEKAVNPYIGMTANCLLLTVDQPFFTLSLEDQLCRIDAMLCATLPDRLLQPSDLKPLPILGIPEWHEQNQHEVFYANTDYFRPVRAEPAHGKSL